MPTTLLVSWNVAGWEATLKYVKTYYGSLSAYLDRHQIDILALQEVKVTKVRMSESAAALGAHLEGWDSFWCFNTTAKKGFNGVTTFARKGLTVAAHAAPLAIETLDAEGRCVLTDHGAFVLFNVYVHSIGEDPDGSRLELKLRFLSTLRERMAELRASGRQVVLAGDLNIAGRGRDVPWPMTRLCLHRIGLANSRTLSAMEDRGGGSASELVEERPAAAGTAEVEALHRLHGLLGNAGLAAVREATAQRVGAQRRVAASELKAILSEVSDHVARFAVRVDPETLEGESKEEGGGGGRGGRGRGVGDAQSCEFAVQSCESATAPAAAPAAAPARAPKRCDSPSAVTEEALLAALHEVAVASGESNSEKRCVHWLESLQSEDGFVDTFAALRPQARGRFTCWDQYTNKRYCNYGRRIDYILATGPLFKSHALAGPPLVDEEDEAGALRACTAGGRWLPAPMSGPCRGLQEAPMSTHHTQFTPPHTGIIYTAPAASDHVAVSVLFDESVIQGRPLTLGTDEATRACSFRPPAKITAFFGAPRKKQKS